MAVKGSLADKVYKEMQDILPKYFFGLRASELKRIISERLPNAKSNSIGARTSLVTEKYPKEFDKVKVKGGGTIYFYVPNVATDKKGDNIVAQTPQYKEEDFYDSFAEYLQRDDDDEENDHLDECTKAIPLGGGSASQGRWGTPDVIGVLRPYDNDDVAFPDEIVSAEIKSDSNSIITAFGQACAYRLFSHKVYLVVPKPTDANRIERLCQIFGIGLVYFDPDQEPDMSIYKLKLPAQKHSPDMFYVNEIVSGSTADKLYDRKIRRHRTRKRK